VISYTPTVDIDTLYDLEINLPYATSSTCSFVSMYASSPVTTITSPSLTCTANGVITLSKTNLKAATSNSIWNANQKYTFELKSDPLLISESSFSATLTINLKN
jgi:hypothetical protein